jgi:hypothetical protein
MLWYWLMNISTALHLIKKLKQKTFYIKWKASYPLKACKSFKTSVDYFRIFFCIMITFIKNQCQQIGWQKT